jgi:phenylalanyl-tRNA synthetase alpha chain
VPDPEGSDSATMELTLSPPERALLRRLQQSKEPVTEEELQPQVALSAEALRGSLQRLRSKHLVVVQEEHLERPVLSARGKALLASGLPERRLLNALVLRGAPLPAGEVASLADLEPEERSVAIGVLRRRGYIDDGMPLRLRSGSANPRERMPEEEQLEAIAGGQALETKALAALRRRGLVDVEHASRRHWAASREGAELALPEGDRPFLGALSVEMLRDGGWKGAEFRPYDVRAEVPYRSGPAPHPYSRFLEEFAEILVGLGFEEAEGPLLETEFWNADVLYMPQDHPARSVHDVFFLQDLVGQLPAEPLLSRVAAAHSGSPMPGTTAAISPGWRVPYQSDVARRPVLRSQTTAVSARYLAGAPAPPFRMFALGRNFRPESLDATHHIEFHQCEGILGEEGTTMRDLLGIFQELAQAIGIRELKVRPGYFPFTEPSVEAFVRHPRLGWIEVFPGGLLRPEVLGPLGIEVPVAAWGIGITRLAMVALHVNDIRELFLDDLGRLTARSE